jgi:hypothetical protein
VEIPSVDDNVSKLEHMGRETVKKLSDIKEAALQAGIDDLKMPEILGCTSSIETVGAFQQLALAAEHVRPSTQFLVLQHLCRLLQLCALHVQRPHPCDPSYKCLWVWVRRQDETCHGGVGCLAWMLLMSAGWCMVHASHTTSAHSALLSPWSPCQGP